MRKSLNLLAALGLGLAFLSSCVTTQPTGSSSAAASSASTGLSSSMTTESTGSSSSSSTAPSSGTASSSASLSSGTASSSVITLAVPTNIVLTTRTLSWDAVGGAISYNVRINASAVYAAPSNQYVLDASLYGLTSIEVQSVAGAVTSAYSSPIDFPLYFTLPAPTGLAQNGDEVNWDVVSLASSYVVKIDGTEYPTSDNSYAVDPTKMSSVAVLAVGNGGYILSSVYSAAITLASTLAAPTGIAYADGVLTWAAVVNATGYEVTINGGTAQHADTNSLTIGYDNVGAVVFAVRALGDVSHFDSPWASKSIQINPLVLATPANLSLNNGLLTWDAVLHADGYKIYVNGDYYDSVIANSYTLPAALLAEKDDYLQVQAISTIQTASGLSARVYVGVIEIDNETSLKSITGQGRYILGADIALSQDWTPLAFTGSLDGGGHVINGIIITGSFSQIGFFSSLEGASITNLNLQGSINASLSSDAGVAGALAGLSTGSIITNVHASMALTIASPNGLGYVGGLIGHAIDTSVSSSLYKGAIGVSDSVAGGLLGWVSDSTTAQTISQSKAKGTLVVTGGNSSYAGGLIGYLHDSFVTISQCVASLDVTGPAIVGGFVGYLGIGKIDNSYAEGTLTATSSTQLQVGGFIGQTEGYNNAVRYCLSYETIIHSGTGNIGSFVGVTPGGTFATIYTECHYDSTLSSLDRIGNTSSGRGDGITGVATASLDGIQNYDSTIWSFAGTRPTLLWEATAND